MQEISDKLLETLDQVGIKGDIKEFATEEYNGQLDAIWSLQTKLNTWLRTIRQSILEQFPLEVGADLATVFEKLKKDEVERFRLLHAEHIVNLKSAEINAISHPEDEDAKKVALKEQILFQIQTSDLQYQMNQAIAATKDVEYEKEIIKSTLSPILNEFSMGEKLGAFEFKFPQSVEGDLTRILESKIKLLRAREANEIELNHYKELFAGYDELTKNLHKYGIFEREEGMLFENLRNANEKEMNRAIELQQQYNHEFAKIVGEFVVNNSMNENDDVIKNIQKVLGSISNQEIGHMMSQAEKETELGWLQWISTQTFASRCKRGMAGLVAAGGIGGVGGIALGAGILSPVTGTLGMVGGGILGGILGFTSPDLTEQTSNKLSELKTMAANFIWGKANKISSEYFKDPKEMTGLNPKYEPTERMRNRWGEKGAEIIGLAYVNFLFDLHVKLLYTADDESRQELEQMYAHFYRNYQMLRGDEVEIKKLYKDDRWGLERAEVQINAAKNINLEAHLKEDLAAMTLIANKEDRERANKVRNAVNVVINGFQTLWDTGNQVLLLQLKEAPEIKLLPSTASTVIGPALLMIEGSKEKPQEEQKEDRKKEKGKEKENKIEREKEKEEKEDIPELLDNLEEDFSRGWQIVERESPTPVSQALLPIDYQALQYQRLATQIKECAVVLANAEKEKEKLKENYHRIEFLTQLAIGNKQMTNDLEQINPSSIKKNTRLHPRMNATEAVDSLKAHKYENFKFWYENIFLVKYHGKDTSTCKDAISRRLLDDEGHPQYEGASLWHILAEDSTLGSDTFRFMMRTQNEADFTPFARYFDFEYVDKNGMNAIVYAASLSGPKNDGLLNAYLNELIASYPDEPDIRQQIDATLSNIVKIKSAQSANVMPICFCLKEQMKKLWQEKQNEKARPKSYTAKALSYAASFTSYAEAAFDDEKSFSSILATMAIHCTNENPVPQSKEELKQFLTRLSKSECVDESMRALILDVEVRTHLAEDSVIYIAQQTLLYQFAQEQKNEKLKSLALEISTSVPAPTKEEQELLKAILSEGTMENIANFTHIMKNHATLIKTLISTNKKFNNKNLLWLAIEAGRADIVEAFYPYFHHEFADNAGPDGSAFTLAAKQNNKQCLVAICDSVSLATTSGLKRLIPDQDNRIAAHYLFETGSWNEIESYLKTEARYSTPNFKRALGGPDKAIKTEPKFYLDRQGNTPLHLLLMREDALEIVSKLNEFAIKKNMSMLDLFDISSLNIPNQDGVTPLMLIDQNEALSEVFFSSITSKEMIDSKCKDPIYQNNLTTCLEYAVMNKQWQLITRINEALKVVHTKNVPYWGSNPVDFQVEMMLDTMLKIYQNDTTSKDQCLKILENINVWGRLVSGSKLIEILDKIQGDNITAKNDFLTQSLCQVAIECKAINSKKADEYLKKFSGNILREIEEPVAINKKDLLVEVKNKKRTSYTPSMDKKKKKKKEEGEGKEQDENIDPTHKRKENPKQS